MPDHKKQDEPDGDYYNMARRAAGVFIFCVLSNLDQGESVYVADCGSKLNAYFQAQLVG
ncbi:MAG TPA: hypothetical protein VF020_09385 [Chthoniobacterales bacterium]